MPPKINPTHFHPTTPQASSKSGASHTFSERVARKPRFNAPPAPSGETPQEKVKRLRAAAARAKAAEISPLDRFLVRGRVWADRAHRITTWSLIAFTGVAAVVTAYTLSDMIIYNRRKRREFHIEQKQIHMSRLAAAREAIALNTATPEQIEFVEMENKLDWYEEQMRNKPGVFQQTKEWLTSGLSNEDASAAAVKENEGEIEQGTIMKAVQEKRDELNGVLAEKRDEVNGVVAEKKEEFTETARKALEREKKLQEQGGMLDRIDEDKPKSGGWTSWMSR